MPLYAAVAKSPNVDLASFSPTDILTVRRKFLEEGPLSRLKRNYTVRKASNVKQPRLALASSDEGVTANVLPGVDVLLVSGPSELKDFLAADPDVQEVVIADTDMFKPPLPVASAGSSTPWHLDAVNVAGARQRNLTGKGVWVGVADTGVDGSHPEFDPSRIVFAVVGRKGMRPVATSKDDDPNSHGTHVSAIIAGRTVGIAPEATLAVAAVFPGHSPATFANVVYGLDWLATVKRPQGGQRGVDIINVSFVALSPSGDAEYNPVLKLVVNSLRQLNIVVVAAIGNSGPGTHGSPGNYSKAIGVGAVDKQMGVWKQSCGGLVAPENNCPKPDVFAPGVDVHSALRGRVYGLKTGTSCAAPAASGVAALICEQLGSRVNVDGELRGRARQSAPGSPKVVSF